MKSIHEIYSEAAEELRKLGIETTRTAARMAQAKAQHPLDRPTPTLTDLHERIARAQRLLTQFDTLLALGIESSQGEFHDAQLTRLPQASPQSADVVTSSKEIGPNLPQWL